MKEIVRIGTALCLAGLATALSAAGAGSADDGVSATAGAGAQTPTASPPPTHARRPAPTLAPTPALDVDEAETDQDLERAEPKGEPTEQPVDRSLKGRMGVSVGTNPDLTTALSVDWWYSERNCLRISISGNYTNNPSPTVSDGGSESQLTWNYGVEAGVRSALVDLGGLGFLFSQLSIGAGQGRNWYQYGESFADNQVPGGIDAQTTTNDLRFSDELLGLRLGAEVFWPGHRDLSFEASWGSYLKWSQNQASLVYTSTDPLNYPTPLPARVAGDASELQVLSNSTGWTGAINFYFR
jgi:hypothetical protein